MLLTTEKAIMSPWKTSRQSRLQANLLQREPHRPQTHKGRMPQTDMAGPEELLHNPVWETRHRVAPDTEKAQNTTLNRQLQQEENGDGACRRPSFL